MVNHDIRNAEHIENSLFFTKKMRAPTRVEEGVFANVCKYSSINNRPLLDNLLSGTNPLFEWIEPHKQSRPYFDIDFKADSKEDYEKHNSEEFLQTAIDVLIMNIKDLNESHIYVDSYNGHKLCPDDKNKYGKYAVSYHITLDGFHTSKAELRKTAKLLKTQFPYYDTAVYDPNQLFRVGGHHKYQNRENGSRSPKLLVKKDGTYTQLTNATKKVNGHSLTEYRKKYLINYLEPDSMEMCLTTTPPTTTLSFHPPPPPPTTPIVTVNENLWDILMNIPQEHCDEREKWWYITKLMKSCVKEPHAKETWEKWSQLSAKYDRTTNMKMWDEIPQGALASSPVTALKRKRAPVNTPPPDQPQKPRSDADEEEMRTLRKIHDAFMDGSDEAVVNLFIEFYKNYFKVVDYKHNVIYLFDRHDCLWKKVSKDFLNSFLTEYFAPLRERYVDKVQTNTTLFFKDEPDDKQMKRLLDNIHGSKMSKVKNNYKIEFFTHSAIQDPMFERKLNSNKDVLSVKNGLVDLKT